MDHKQAPFFNNLVKYSQSGVYPFHTPAHRGLYSAPNIEKILTPLGLACDLPAMQPTDSNFHPERSLAKAQQLAADLWSASHSFFLTNGSTIGVQAMMLATLSTNDKVILSRQVHISTLSGLTLTGAHPIYLNSHFLDTAGTIPPTVEDVAQCLSDHPDARAVLITHPSYYGIARPLNEIAKLCHQHGIPLLVDEAHGAHLNFLPKGCLSSALLAGADIVVQSAHKTLGSLIGTAQILLGKHSLLKPECVQRALNLLQSTSSNYLLLASLDLTRCWMAQEGLELFYKANLLACDIRKRLNRITGLRVLEIENHAELEGCVNDPLRLVIDVSGFGISGYECGKILFNKFKLYDEFCDDRNIVYVLSSIDQTKHFEYLEKAFQQLSNNYKNATQPTKAKIYSITPPPMKLTPKKAFTYKQKRLPMTQAKGQICGETITLYPPGVPLICIGEEITETVINHCQQLRLLPIVIYAEDSSLINITVLDC